MKQLAISGIVLMASILMLSLFVAQGREGVRAGSTPAAPSPSGSTGSTTSGSSGGTTGSTGTVTPPSTHTPNTGTPVYQPNLQGTSFYSFNSYYNWNNYYSYLLTQFNLNPLYFDRFYRNSEPLITPAILKLTLREPIRLSSEILDSVDQLQEMLDAAPEGTQTDRQALVEKSRHIRELAKQIRRNQTLTNYDLRENKNLYGETGQDAFSPEAMQKLRGMATDLDHQLRDMYRQSSTSTVSVDSYKQPSLESLVKGIEKICKDIEAQSKKL
ncbi:MAG TPA: hypothetical protein VMG30_15250 [Acidobacteriota bacterium]|nr:hypothetical protein [Acidobacteriota bacterium]